MRAKEKGRDPPWVRPWPEADTPKVGDRIWMVSNARGDIVEGTIRTIYTGYLDSKGRCDPGYIFSLDDTSIGGMPASERFTKWDLIYAQGKGHCR